MGSFLRETPFSLCGTPCLKIGETNKKSIKQNQDSFGSKKSWSLFADKPLECQTTVIAVDGTLSLAGRLSFVRIRFQFACYSSSSPFTRFPQVELLVGSSCEFFPLVLDRLLLLFTAV